MTLTPLATTVYLSHHPTLPLAAAYPLSVCQNVLRNKGYISFFFPRGSEKKIKKHFHSFEIGNDILIYVNIKQVFFDFWLNLLCIY